MKNKIKLITYCFIVLLAFGFCLKAYADTEEDLKNKQNEIDQKILDTNTEIAGVKEEMTTKLEQINKLNSEIDQYEETLDTTSSKLDELNKELESQEKEYKLASQDYSQKKEEIEKRLVEMYETSGNTYLDVLLGSTSLSDFLTKYYALEQIAEFDKKNLQSIETYQTAVGIKNTLVEKKKNEVENTKDTLDAKTKAMGVLINEKDNIVQSLSDQERQLNEQLEQFEQDKKDIQNQLEEIARQNALKKSLIPSESGYISPLAGKTKANITTGFKGYVGHTGVDFATPLGTEVLAVKAGTVVVSEAKKNSNGTYRSYGEFIVIDHHDGTMTLYAHGSPDSRQVQVRR